MKTDVDVPGAAARFRTTEHASRLQRRLDEARRRGRPLPRWDDIAPLLER